MLRRDVGDDTEFLLVTLWDSLDAVKAFAGPDYETAVFYPEDDRYLVERDRAVTHYFVDTEVRPTGAKISVPPANRLVAGPGCPSTPRTP
jgi:heme-degrading monooxygenase HmoA